MMSMEEAGMSGGAAQGTPADPLALLLSQRGVTMTARLSQQGRVATLAAAARARSGVAAASAKVAATAVKVAAAWGTALHHQQLVAMCSHRALLLLHLLLPQLRLVLLPSLLHPMMTVGAAAVHQ